MDESLDFDESFSAKSPESQEDEPPFICPGCKKEYKSLKNKKRHMDKCKKIVREPSPEREPEPEVMEVPTAVEEETKGQSGGEEDLQYNSPTPSSQESSQEVEEGKESSRVASDSTEESKEEEEAQESEDEEFTLIEGNEVEEAEREEKRLKEEAEANKKEETMEVEKEQVDELELCSAQDEIDLTLDNKQSDGECSDTEEKKEEEKVEVVAEEKVEEKKVILPPVIHNRTFAMSEAVPEQAVRVWGGIVKEPANITTTLLKDLIDVKLSLEEDKKEEEMKKSRNVKPSKEDRPVNTMRSKEKKPKEKRKKRDEEENELDFEPGTESDDDSIDVKTGIAKDPTAFPTAPVEPAPKSRKEPNRALLITNLVRPFTILQLKAMLSHCGKVKSIWINTIKSRCYAVFASIEEATRARETIHGAVWPSTSNKILNVDYAEDERMYSETDGELVGDNIDITVIEEQKRKKPKKEKERKRQKTGEEEDEDDTPANVLDTLFKKTKASPCIYWLPLNEEQAKAREEEKAKSKPVYFAAEPAEEEIKPRPRAMPKWSPARRAAVAERRGDRPRRPRSVDRPRR